MRRLAIVDDWAGHAAGMPHWQMLAGRIAITPFADSVGDDAALVARLAPFEIVVGIRERTFFRRSVIEKLPRLKMIVLAGPHTGQVDLEAAKECGIAVTDTEGSTVSAVELTMALMLAVVRRVAQEDRALREGRWQTPPIGTELNGKTLGVIGLGRIGTKIAEFGKLLGMRVLASGLSLTDERAAAAAATRVSLDTLMAESDVVTLHLRLSDKSRGVVSARHLALMKPTAYLVNTARGPLVDEAALVAALRDRRIAGAALDVFDVEPLPPRHPLLGLDNVVMTPHVGFVTRENYEVFLRGVVASVTAFLDGARLPRALA